MEQIALDPQKTALCDCYKNHLSQKSLQAAELTYNLASDFSLYGCSRNSYHSFLPILQSCVQISYKLNHFHTYPHDVCNPDPPTITYMLIQSDCHAINRIMNSYDSCADLLNSAETMLSMRSQLFGNLRSHCVLYLCDFLVS